jgi:hypothetical protein
MTTMSKTSEMSARLRGVGTPSSEASSKVLARTAESWFAAVTEYQREMVDFVSMRLKKDGVAVRDMMGCKSPTDAAAVQSRWIEQTLRDYNSETKKLMTICTRSIKAGGDVNG